MEKRKEDVEDGIEDVKSTPILEVVSRLFQAVIYDQIKPPKETISSTHTQAVAMIKILPMDESLTRQRPHRGHSHPNPQFVKVEVQNDCA